MNKQDYDALLEQATASSAVFERMRLNPIDGSDQVLNELIYDMGECLEDVGHLIEAKGGESNGLSEHQH